VEKTALLIAVAGMIALFCFMLFDMPQEINANTNISTITENTPLHLEGTIIDITKSGTDYLVSLDSGMSFASDQLLKKGDNVSVRAVTELYYTTMRIRALSITK
jgi:hypothetical protein